MSDPKNTHRHCVLETVKRMRSASEEDFLEIVAEMSVLAETFDSSVRKIIESKDAEIIALQREVALRNELLEEMKADSEDLEELEVRTPSVAAIRHLVVPEPILPSKSGDYLLPWTTDRNSLTNVSVDSLTKDRIWALRFFSRAAIAGFQWLKRGQIEEFAASIGKGPKKGWSGAISTLAKLNLIMIVGNKTSESLYRITEEGMSWNLAFDMEEAEFIQHMNDAPPIEDQEASSAPH